MKLLRFDEKGVASPATSFRGFPLVLAVALLLAGSAQGGMCFETKDDDATKYYFGDSGTGTKKANIDISDDDTTVNRRFAFRSGTVDVNEGGYVKFDSYEKGEAQSKYGCWIGANGNHATLNVNGGTFWAATNGLHDLDTYTGMGRVRIGVNGDSSGRGGKAVVNVNSGTFRVDNYLYVGATKYNTANAYAYPAELNINSGTVIVRTLCLGTTSAGEYSTATLNFNGGELRIGRKFALCGYHNQTFNWGNGKLVGEVANFFDTASPLADCTRLCSVNGNPSVFDTGGFAQRFSTAITNGTGTLKITGGGTVTLYSQPSFKFYLDDNVTLALNSAMDSRLDVSDSFTFAGVVRVTGALALGAGAKIVCDTDALAAGASASLTVSGGIALPEGVASVLDLLEVRGANAAQYEASFADNTISVARPNAVVRAVWTGGAGADAPASWRCYTADGGEPVEGAIPNSGTGSVTLEADADWTSPGALGFATGAIIDMNGHGLSVSDISYGSIFDGTTVTNGTETISALTVHVPFGETVENRAVSIMGNITVVKTGAGVFVATKPGHSYSGDTDITAGTLRLGASASGLLGNGFVRLRDGTFLDVCGHYLYRTVYMYGGTLQSSVDFTAKTDDMLHAVRLEADTTLNVDASFGFRWEGDKEKSYLNLNGHVLDVNIAAGKKLYLSYAQIHGGTMNISGDGIVVTDNSYSGYSTLDLIAGSVFDLHSPVSTSNYVSRVDHDGNLASSTNYVGVWGTFRPETKYFHRSFLHGGITIDLTQWPASAGWPVRSHFTEGRREISFENNAAYAVDLSGRDDLWRLARSESPYVLKWGEVENALAVRPVNATFTLDPASEALGFKLAEDDTGLRLDAREGLVITVH